MPRGAELTRITIVEDHDLFAEALDLAITLQGHAVTRVSARDLPPSADTFVRAVLRHRPQIVLLDLDLGGLDGRELVEPLSRADIIVVVLSATEDRARLGECLALGARAVMSKVVGLNAVTGAIRRVACGQPAMGREEREELLACFHREHVRSSRTRAALATLSPREGEVLAALMQGTTVSDIARTSYVSEATVRTQVKSIRAKLGVSSQLAAVGAARRVRWEPPRQRLG